GSCRRTTPAVAAAHGESAATGGGILPGVDAGSASAGRGPATTSCHRTAGGARPTVDAPADPHPAGVGGRRPATAVGPTAGGAAPASAAGSPSVGGPRDLCRRRAAERAEAAAGAAQRRRHACDGGEPAAVRRSPLAARLAGQRREPAGSLPGRRCVDR